jgi:hypothetical protein
VSSVPLAPQTNKVLYWVQASSRSGQLFNSPVWHFSHLTVFVLPVAHVQDEDQYVVGRVDTIPGFYGMPSSL